MLRHARIRRNGGTGYEVLKEMQYRSTDIGHKESETEPRERENGIERGVVDGVGEDVG